MKRPETPKATQKAARTGRLAKALKANIKRRKTAADGAKRGQSDDGQE